MRKKIVIVSFCIFSFSLVLPKAIAGENEQNIGTAVLPEGNSCESITKADYLIKPQGDAANVNNLIGCAIKNGEIHIWMIPYFLKYLAEFLIGLAGILCMLFITIGGYHYVFGGVTEEKEKGKLTLIYAIIGLILVLLSWTIVNVVLFVVTG